MDRSPIGDIKQARAAHYAEKGQSDTAERIASGEADYSPVFKPRSIHPEEEPVVEEVNDFLTDIGHDLTIINEELALSGERFGELMADTKTRLEAVQRAIAIEEVRLKDLNMLCGDHSEFDAVETLTVDDFERAFSDYDGVFHAQPMESSPVGLTAIDVQGNGYEGNEFVYRNKAFVADRMFTGNRFNITNRGVNSYYEYSRLNAKVREEPSFSYINYDGVEAECTITLMASSPISSLEILSDMENITLRDIRVSDDDAVYRSVLDEPLDFNDRDGIYRSGGYVYGSGVIGFPASTYIKLTFRSDGHTDDKIAFLFQDATL